MNDNKRDVYDILNALEEAEKKKSEQKNSVERTQAGRNVSKSETGQERTISERRASANTSTVRRNAEDDASKTKTMQRKPADSTQQRTRSSQTRQTSGTQSMKKRPQREYEVISENKSDAKNNKKKKEPKKKRTNHLARLIVLLVVIVVISVSLSGVIISFGRDMLGVGRSNETVVVTVQDGATVNDIAQMLKDDGIIRNPKFFRLFSKISKTDSLFIAGDHEVRADMAYETLIKALTSDAISDENSVSVTFVEGTTLPEAAETLEIEGVCDADEFIEAFNKADNYGLEYEKHMPTFSNNSKFYKMEGYLFPDTYTFYKDMSPDLVCQKILKNFDSKFTADMYAKMDSEKMSLDDVIILASMVQKEAGTAEDMPLVASVFLNRLKDSNTYPRLQSDATSTYVEDTIKPHISEIDQELFDAYDTYTCTGLPAGAICNPGLDAINAVLNPANTDYYYFYSDMKTGETFFAETYEEHLANIDKVNEKYGIKTTDESEDSTDDSETSEENNE